MRNAGLDEAQAGIKIAGRNINNLRYADDTTLMAESEEELQSHIAFSIQVFYIPSSVQSLSSVGLFVTPMNCIVRGFPVLHYLLEFPLTHVC